MGKVVKYCNACDEGFAEKFGFCPNCGAQLQAFELNPVTAAPAAEAKPEQVIVPPAVAAPIVEPPAAESPVVESSMPVIAAPEVDEDDILEFDDPIDAAPVTVAGVQTGLTVAEAEAVLDAGDADIEPGPVEVPAATVPAITVQSAPVWDEPAKRVEPVTEAYPHYVDDGGYSPTIVYEKNVGQRNKLLLGAFALMVLTLCGSYVYSMFNKYLDIAAIETPDLVSYVEEVDPTAMDLEPPPKKNKDEGGGGGGGGKDEETPASQGRMATQVDKPMFAPSANMDRVTNPEIAIQAATQGNKKAPQTDENYGLPNGISGRSDGPGTGGGLGGGRGTGQGNGQGTGQGNGNGSGSGNGLGNGNGNGTGDGDDGDGPPQVKVPPVGPTEGVKILSKPRANYTDAARQANLQGKVVLRVTFSANGSIGAISVISGLGSGLTEQAIAAARGMRFEPAKKGGVPYSVTKPVEYSFTIY